MNDSISILEQLVTAIEQAGVNVAPTYQEYMPLAFAIANSCGERRTHPVPPHLPHIRKVPPR